MLIRSILASGVMLAALAVPAYAQPQESEAPFRAAEPRQFTAEDMQRYGLTEQEAARGTELQEQGYHIVALTPEEAEAYRAGAMSQTEWILIGVGVLVIIAIL